MDTTTVLTIIKMIETRISYIQAGSGHFFEWDRGALDVLSDLHQHLQDYIEGQVSAIENSTGE
jgi:hypothetical protein